MGRMKEVFMLKREQEINEDVHLDDEYWYKKYLEEQEYIKAEKNQIVQDIVQESVQEKKE